MAYALQSDGTAAYGQGDLASTLAGDFTLRYVGQISGLALGGAFNNLLAISEPGGAGDYIGIALDSSSTNKVKIISNGKTPGVGTTTVNYNQTYTLEIRYIQSTNTASFYIDNIFEYSVNPTGGATWIPTLTKYRVFSGTGISSFGFAMLEDGTEIIDLDTPANSIQLNPTSSNGTGSILPDDSANNKNATLTGFGVISWVVPTSTSAVPVIATTAIQGFARNADFWYMFDTLYGSSVDAIRKIDATTGTQTSVNLTPYASLGAGTWKLNDGFEELGVVYNPVQDTAGGTKTLTSYSASTLAFIASIDITSTGAYNAGCCKGHTGNVFFVGNGNAPADPRNTNVTETTLLEYAIL